MLDDWSQQLNHLQQIANNSTDLDFLKKEVLRTVDVILGKEKSANAKPDSILDYKIIDVGLKPKTGSSLFNRIKTTEIILHHSASVEPLTVEEVDKMHKNNKAEDYSMIAYHYFIDKLGNIYVGRHEKAVGAHCFGKNRDSIGICFDGNFEKELMTSSQVLAGKWLIAKLQKDYRYKLSVTAHRFAALKERATACPGKNFPYEQFGINI